MENQAPHIHGPQATGTDEDKISRLLSALPRVEAPSDFGFRVKAGIANGKPAETTPLWLPTAAKAVLPLMLMALVGGYFVVTALYTPDDTPMAAVSRQDEPATRIEDQTPISAPGSVLEQNLDPVITAKAPETPEIDPPTLAAPSRTVAVRQISVRKRVRSSAAPDEGSGSTDAAALITKELSKKNDTAVMPGSVPKGERAGEVLTRIGVNALFGEAGWKAESVTPNTAAAKAGVKAGDVIESVDDQTMTDLGSVGKPAKGKKLRVLREGRSIEIVIDP